MVVNVETKHVEQACDNASSVAPVRNSRQSGKGMFFRFEIQSFDSTISMYMYKMRGDRGSTVVKVLCTNRKVAGSIPAGVSGFFIDIKSFR